MSTTRPHSRLLPGRRIASVIVAATVFATACSSPERTARNADGRPLVAVSVAPMAYWVERLAGDAVRVEVIVPPGARPSTFEPTIRQVLAVSDTALFVRVGHPHFPFEQTWLRDLLVETPDAAVFDCWLPKDGGGDGVDEDTRGHAHEFEDEDPHVWLSTVTARTIIGRLADKLAELLPEQRAEIASNRDALLADLALTDRSIAEKLRAARGKSFYVFHPAWGHFAERYGLEQVAVEDHGKEPDPHTLAKLIERARTDGVRAVFVQPQFSTKSAEVIAHEIGAELVTIDPLSRDWLNNLERIADALARELAPEAPR